MNKENKPDYIGEKLSLQLYVSGMSPKSLEAIKNINFICEHYIKDLYELEIIDIYKNPEMASEQSIVFCPSLIKLSPLPKKTLIGTLQDTDRVLRALDISIDKTE